MDEKNQNSQELHSEDFDLDAILNQLSWDKPMPEEHSQSADDSTGEEVSAPLEVLQELSDRPSLAENDTRVLPALSEEIPVEEETPAENDAVTVEETNVQPLKKDRKSEKKTKKDRKKKRKKKKSGLQRFLTTFLWLFCIVSVSLALAFGGLYALSDYTGLAKDVFNGGEKSEMQIIIKQGATVKEVALQLEEEGVLLNRHVFLLYLKVTGKGGNINYGAHDFSSSMSYNEILDSLARPVKAEDVEVVIPACATVDEIAVILEKAGVCTAADFIKETIHGEFDSALLDAVPEHESIHYRMEGYLFPDTYHFYLNDSPHRVIQKMLDNLEEKFTDEMLAEIQKKGYTTHEIMTMASVVQMEADGYFEDMPKVAAVFYNRLNDWPEGQRFLQSDPTNKYAYGNGTYDTYEIEGLPPGPMSSITEEAILAAVYPDKKVKDYFFVTDIEGKFYYNETESDHESTIRELKNQGLWLYTTLN